MITLVFTLIGDDRPGLVESVSGVVARHGANWLESRLAHLSGQFAGIVRVEVPASRADALTSELSTLERSGLRLHVHSSPRTEPAAPAATARLDVMGHDRPGIVSRITQVLAARAVNVEEFSSEIRSAPMSADMLFHATATLTVPPDADLDALRTDLETIAGDLMVDVTLA